MLADAMDAAWAAAMGGSDGWLMPPAWLRGRRRSGAGGDGWTCIVVEKYTSRVYTVCRGMTVCARCYIKFV